MGTDVGVIVVGSDADPSERLANRLADQALTRIAELESLWSRFRPDSEVSRLNAAAGTAVQVSTDTVHLVRRAVGAWRLSAGFVDGTELAAIIEAGYDRSFEELPADRTQPADDGARRHMTFAGPGDITIDGHDVTIPAGVGFDPGGIGKGLAADLVSAELITGGAAGVCINMGGDLRVRGLAPRGRHGGTIALEHPEHRTPLAMVGITDGGVASSTTLRRRWLVGGQVRHHLIDPRTGKPSESEIAFCSVVADAAWKAETLAKAILLRGGDHPFDLIDGTDVEALIVDRSGAVACSPGFTRFTGGHAPPPHITNERALEESVA
jgi:thiamine biosynthesis lipoprotein